MVLKGTMVTKYSISVILSPGSFVERTVSKLSGQVMIGCSEPSPVIRSLQCRLVTYVYKDKLENGLTYK